MKTQNSIIAAITIVTIAVMALLTSFTASANVYEDRLNEAFDDLISAVAINDMSQTHNIYTNPETGVKEGQLDVYKFTIGNEGMDLINAAKEVYEQISKDQDKGLITNKELYTLWWSNNADNFQGYRLYYDPENTVVVGLACDYCYTVGFIAPDDAKLRTTHTIEWSEPDGNGSINGRIVNTYAPIKPKVSDGHRRGTIVINTDDYDKYMEQFQAGMEEYQKGMEKYQAAMEKAQGALSNLSDGQGLSLSVSTSSKNNAKDWMKKLLFYVNKVQENGNRYIYLSKLYELCKDTEGLDQTDLKIAAKQLESVYKQLKEKKKLKENELQFLESMVDLLQSKIKK